VVLLQEVSRGSLSSGTTDVAVWLSRRLGMHLVWGPAADAQSGNAILTSRSVRSSGTVRLPTSDGSRIRGYVWARLDVGGRTAEVWSTRLDDREGQVGIRKSEISALLKAWGEAPRTIIAGDMGAGPGSEEISRLVDGTGLRSAWLDSDITATTPKGAKVDWIFGSDDVMFSGAETGRSAASDHYPIAATVRLGH
jgi:endonuclease/exonuclease/phosphatase family metal-dependent hydrolase